MNALIRAELLELRTRSLAGLLIATIALGPLTLAVGVALQFTPRRDVR